MNLFSNIRRAGRYFLPALAAFVLLPACSDDDEIQTPLDTPNVTSSGQTVSSLTFVWDAVSNVSSSSCELSDSNGTEVAGLVTTSTTARFTDLTPNTTYTLEVYAYAAIGSQNTTSKVATLTATTLPIVPLDKPEPVATVDGGTVTVTWPSVANAETYTYYYVSSDGTATDPVSTDGTTVRLSLSTGSYTFYVYADSEDEAYSESEEASVAFEVTRVELYSGVTASVDYGGYSWNVSVTAYADGGYTIFNWYGYDVNLEFTVDAAGEVSFSGCENDGYYWYLPYDAENPDYIVYAYDAAFTRQGNTCTLSFTDYYYGNATFTWEAPGFGIDDLIGTYNETASGYDSYVWGWGTADNSFSYNDNTVTIEKVDETTVQVNGFYWLSDTLVGTVDAEARTITFAPGQVINQWYTFAAETGENDPVVATIDDSGALTITVEGWSAWYSGYYYVWSARNVLTKQN